MTNVDIYRVFSSRIRIFFIPDPDFLRIPDPGSRGQKVTGSRIRNVNLPRSGSTDQWNPDPNNY
jgi:hypothetical protein